MYMYIIIATGIGLMVTERVFPDMKLEKVHGWWPRVIIINLLQLGIVLLAGQTWDIWLKEYSLIHIEQHMSPLISSITLYVLITFVFYWWHRWRHTVGFLWNTCHQIHHSPARIETITSFYKHPFEILLNSILISFIIYTLFGASAHVGGLLTIWTALAEYAYHMNIKTPRWWGYILQRPEMHRIHHERGVHFSNFADLPIWDMMFGTYKNPDTFQGKCGFKPERELKFWPMMAFKNVNRPYEKNK